MNLIIRTAISTQLSSRPSPKCLCLLPRCTIAIQQVSPFSTTSESTSTKRVRKAQQPKKPRTPKSSPPLTWSQTVKKGAGTSKSTWPRPSEIPYQPKVANSVNLIGRIQIPIQFHATPDGKHMAATLIAQENGNSPNSLLIPIVFEGDLAHTVACHVKRNDCVYVTGKLSLNPLPFLWSENQGTFHVIGNEINFVQGLDMQGSNPIEKNVEDNNLVKEQVGDRKSSVDNNAKVKEEREEFLSKPDQWFGITSQDDVLKGAIEEFEQKVDGKLLELDNSTPLGVYKKLEDLNLENKNEEKKIEPLNTDKKSSRIFGGTAKDGDSVFNSWRDLVKNPTDWRDYREKKSSGSLKANYPDFKHKSNGTALWLNGAPYWVLPGLEGLFVDAQVQVPKGQQAKGLKGKNEDSWKNLIENPDKWWDNRSRKTNVKAPDFKHKETGEALWLNSSPEWALSQLPSSKNELNIAAVNKKAYVT